MSDNPGEIAACRQISAKCFFIVGYARSSTTLALGLLNSHPRVYLTGEAHYFQERPGDNFVAAYNAQHVEYRNQVSKSSYAPDFLPGQAHDWLHWLEQASLRYDVVGDKIALSPFFMSNGGATNVRLFFERRFFDSRYFFLHRHPVQSTLSAIRAFGLTTQSLVAEHISSWLDYVQLWADMVRYFPNTRTCFSEQIDANEIAALGRFAGVSLDEDLSKLIVEERRQVHEIPKEQTVLSSLAPALTDLHFAIRNAYLACDPERSITNVDAFNEPWAQAEMLKAKVNAALSMGGSA